MNLDLIIAAATFSVGAIVWTWRMHAAFRRPSVASKATAASLDVSIIVPARNEAHNLPALLDSLSTLQPPAKQIIVVDDHSHDGTGDIARAAGATVVTPPPLPDDWNGKPWACHAGAKVATGRYLLFTDADTVHAPDSLARAVATAETERADMVSVIPSHIVRTTWERFQGVFHLLLLIATSAGARKAKGERRFSIGQYLLFTRAAYDRVGGHETVRRRIAEDLALAKAVAESDGHVATAHCPGLLSVRMYPEGFGAFMRGWRRSFYDGLASAGAVATVELTAVIGWLLGAPLLLARSIIAGEVPGIVLGGALYVLAVLAVAHRQRGIGTFSIVTAPAYPIFVVVFAVVSVVALIDRLRGAAVVWKGRQVITE